VDRSLAGTTLWREASGIAAALERTLREGRGFEDVVDLMRGSRRIVATGNGASYYAALTFWLASLEDEAPPLDVVAVPAGLLAAGEFGWRDGDLMFALSSSGELRDVLAALDAGAPRPYAALTANLDSSIARHAAAVAAVHVETQDAPTHTQAYCGAVAVTLALWGLLCGDTSFAGVHEAPGQVAEALAAAPRWAAEVADRLGRPSAALVAGSGFTWPAALESALLLAEVAGIPSQGLETREGATTGMYALAAGALVLALASGPDPLLDDAESVWRETGAEVVRVPDPGGEEMLAAVTTFPAALALAIELALRGERDVDRPPWVAAYERAAHLRLSEERPAPPR
jgi:glucosamine 6-phosphate synthetase-like amidotransferase/phosphosugar isomerase protein